MPHAVFNFRAVGAGLALLLVPLFLLGDRSALAQPARSPLKRAAVALDTSTEVIKRLATVEDHVKERQWGQAILILQQVAADHGDTMIALTPRRFLNVATYCNSVLANFPPEGLTIYREKHDAQARQWLDTGLATRNQALLEKVVRQAFVSSSGDDALFWLGEWAWDRGNFPAARDYWRQLLTLPNPPDVGRPQTVLRYPDSSYPQALVLARIVLCHIMEGDAELASNWLKYLSEHYPEARGELAGRTGKFTEILQEVLNESRGWNFPSQQSDLPTFAGNSRRNFPHPKPPEVGGLQWEHPLPEHHHDPPSLLRHKTEPSLSFFPVTVENTLFFCDPHRIYAIDLLTGQPRWPRYGEGKITDREDLRAAAIHETSAVTFSRESYRVGVPRFTLTVHENRLYARMGSPITGPISIRSSPSDSHLVCLDLTKEGKMVWTAEPADVLTGMNPETKRQWAFEGAPIVEGGRVFVAMRQSHPQTEALVACLDAETGKPQWTRRVASALAGVAEQQNVISHLLLTLGENMVFFMPEFGVVTALDAQDGRLLWAVIYPSHPPKESPILKEPRKQGLTPGVFHRGVLYAAPTDSESILAISAKTGVLLWEREIPVKQDQIRHVLGIVKNRLVLSGNHLWILNAVTGAIEAPARLPPGTAPEHDGYGRGIIAGDLIFWPTRSTIEIRNLAGQRTKQPEPHPGGNLAIAGDLLLVAEPKRLAAYGNFAQVREKQRELISQNPNAALPRWRLAQVEEASGDFLMALKLYEEAIAKATPQDIIAEHPLKQLASESRFQLLLRLGNKALADGFPVRAVRHFQEAVETSQDPAPRGEALELLGTAQTQANQIAEAVGTFQAILDEPSLSEQPSQRDAKTSLGQFAKDQIAALIRKHGRENYAQFDRLAAESIAAHLKDRDLEGVEDMLRRYPNALVTSETKHQLARLKNDQGESRSAIRIWRQLLEEPTTAETRQAVLWELAQTLERQHYLRPAREVWQQLLREFPAATLPTEESPQTAAFVSRHLQGENYRQLDQPAPALPLTRRWERDLEPGARVVIPQGEPPGPMLACVLIDSRGLVCVDTSQGKTRWRKQFNNAVIWAAHGAMQLVVGTKNALRAVTLETGQTLWRVSLDDAEDPANGVLNFQLAGDQILILRNHQLSGHEIDTGRMVWNVASSARLSDIWHADENFVAVQTETPLRVWVIETKTGKRLSEHHPPEAWVSPPVPIQSQPSSPGSLPNNRGFAAALANRHIHAFGAHDRQAGPAWIYQGATSYANAPPRFWSREEYLLMLMDGDTLVKLAPETGETLWFNPLAQSPLPDPANALVLERSHVYAAENQTLHGLRLKDGRPAWQQPLPASPAWLLRKAGKFLMAVPMRSQAPNAQAILFQAETGEPIQKLSIPPNAVELVFRREGSFVVTQEKLLGWGPMRISLGTN